MPRPDLLQRLAHAVAAREQAGLLRRVRTIEAHRGAHVRIGDRELLAFCSNDYLGLAQHPELIAALQRAAAEGVGSGAAHLVSGHHREHALLQDALAEWTGREAALLFSTGVMANAGIMQVLLAPRDVCVQDKLNHTSLIEDARASGAELRRYPHLDVAGATRQLTRSHDRAALLASDGVFSMDGDIAPLADLATLCAREGAALMVDDAHGLGVLGDDGAGSVAAAGLTQADVPVLMGTLGKALGCAGAFVAGSAAVIEGLTQFARSHVYTTAMPPALAAAARSAVHIARHETWRRQKLIALIVHFRRGAAQRGLPLGDSRTPIQPIVLGDAARAVVVAQTLERAGFLVVAIRPPTVPAGRARLRVTLSVAHEEMDIDRLLDALAAAIGKASDAGQAQT